LERVVAAYAASHPDSKLAIYGLVRCSMLQPGRFAPIVVAAAAFSPPGAFSPPLLRLPRKTGRFLLDSLDSAHDDCCSTS